MNRSYPYNWRCRTCGRACGRFADGVRHVESDGWTVVQCDHDHDPEPDLIPPQANVGQP